MSFFMKNSRIECVDECVDECMDECVDECMDECVDECMDKINQFQVECVRCSKNEIIQLENRLDDLLAFIIGKEMRNYIKQLFQFIGFTRDIVEGKGEKDLAYMMIHVWYKHSPELAMFALTQFVELPSIGSPIGSWKDIKKLCMYVFSRTNDKHHPLIEDAIGLMCRQLKIDSDESDDNRLSLVARWVPRETSTQYSWIFRILAEKYIPDFIKTAKTIESQSKAKRKTYMTFARFIAGLNRRLDTVQIKMCENRWADIDPESVPSNAFCKNKRAFFGFGFGHSFIHQNISGPKWDDRMKCAENFRRYMSERVERIKRKDLMGGSRFEDERYTSFSEKVDMIFNSLLGKWAKSPIFQ